MESIVRILLISGHGAGDSGAIGNGLEEATLTRQATNILEGKLHAYDCKVTRYPTTRNAYADNVAGLDMKWRSYDLVIEVHFNDEPTKTAHGTEVLFKNQKTLATQVSAAIAAAGGFTNRGAKPRDNLKNMNTCTAAGVPFILIETCFIGNKDDIEKYKRKTDAVWTAVCSVVTSYYKVPKLANTGGDAVKQGWKKEGGVWYFYKTGKKVVKSWQTDSTGKWCYLGDNGAQVKAEWIKTNGAWYYIKADGYMADDEWVQYKGHWYYLKTGGKMATGKVSVTHTFDSEGRATK